MGILSENFILKLKSSQSSLFCHSKFEFSSCITIPYHNACLQTTDDWWNALEGKYARYYFPPFIHRIFGTGAVRDAKSLIVKLTFVIFLYCNKSILSILHEAINVVLFFFQVACFSISHWLKSDVSLESLSPDYGLSWELPLLSPLSNSDFHLLTLVGFYQHSSKLHGHSFREGWRNPYRHQHKLFSRHEMKIHSCIQTNRDTIFGFLWVYK